MSSVLPEPNGDNGCEQVTYLANNPKFLIFKGMCGELDWSGR